MLAGRAAAEILVSQQDFRIFVLLLVHREVWFGSNPIFLESQVHKQMLAESFLSVAVRYRAGIIWSVSTSSLCKGISVELKSLN